MVAQFSFKASRPSELTIVKGETLSFHRYSCRYRYRYNRYNRYNRYRYNRYNRYRYSCRRRYKRQLELGNFFIIEAIIIYRVIDDNWVEVSLGERCGIVPIQYIAQQEDMRLDITCDTISLPDQLIIPSGVNIF